MVCNALRCVVSCYIYTYMYTLRVVVLMALENMCILHTAVRIARECVCSRAERTESATGIRGE